MQVERVNELAPSHRMGQMSYSLKRCALCPSPFPLSPCFPDIPPHSVAPKEVFSSPSLIQYSLF